MSDFKHCDDYIDDETQPEALRTFLDYARSPAHGSTRAEPKPKLFADLRGKCVRINMASRLGDVGYTSKFSDDYGYDGRLLLSEFTNFRSKP